MLRLVIALAVLLSSTAAQSVDQDVYAAARKKAEESMRRSDASLFPTGGIFAKSEEGSCSSGHSYVKFNSLSEELAEGSNFNLLIYKYLIDAGAHPDAAIARLREDRPDFCNAAPPACNPYYRYRSADGSCNNLDNPLWGAVNTEIRRILPAEYSDGYNVQKGGDGQVVPFSLPNPRLVSTTMHPDFIKPDTKVTHMLPIFGQFLDHDISLTAEGDMHCCNNPNANHPDWWPIPIFSNDTFYSKLLVPRTCMDFTRSSAFCFPTETGIREQMNLLTHFIDASNVYGSDETRSNYVRSGDKGRLRTLTGNPNMLPTNAEIEALFGKNPMVMGTFLAGDDRVNEMPGLTVLHTLWFREHNRIADGISRLMPFWTDEEIFQETRRLVLAEWQNVVYGEYLPALLGTDTMSKYGLTLRPFWSTYDRTLEPGVFHAFADAAYRFGHTFINGIVQLYKGMANIGQYRIRDNFFVSNQVTQDGGKGYNYILDGLLRQNAQTYDRFVTEDLTNFVLRLPTEEFGADLIARNLHRARDHGLPGWMSYRQHCGLEVSNDWGRRVADVEAASWDKLSTLYENVEDVDLFTGGLVEAPGSGALTGSTFNCLKAIQFKKLKEGDRFFFTHGGQVASFWEYQIQHLRRRTLGDIICENSDVAQTQKNVFLTRDSVNIWIPCNSTNRARLDLTLFID